MLAGPKIPQGRTHSYYPCHFNAICPVKMSIGRKSPTDFHSEMIFLQGKPIYYPLANEVAKGYCNELDKFVLSRNLTVRL
jgi:hypothetical protein